MIRFTSTHLVRYVKKKKKLQIKGVGDKERKVTIEMHPMSPGTCGVLGTFTHANIMMQEEAGSQSLLGLINEQALKI